MKWPVNGFAGARYNIGDTEVIRMQGGRQAPLESAAEQSSTGMDWGYSGSAPADLALSILASYTGNREAALTCHQAFMAEFVAEFEDEWSISDDEIRDWLLKRGIL
ncbi:DUF6166 domain-containing protein [Alicyclobacillus sp. ALC3]|uniref:DUF6166 domain-containing protein n=1 Tax=Alicyclobacillus sp. ALC3 TaxID=2796143 RepID=UPI0023796A18|nr:DUF6166 domain-containing protein [Alicyclobacillus sp. ALC3]WDL99788.1 hypothetical protein JC200_23745 [Alicyclobacillus sp. ALC3]